MFLQKRVLLAEIVCNLICTSIRISELCVPLLPSVYLYHGFIKIYGKGDKERGIQTCQDVILEVLHGYKRFCFTSSSPNPFFFINHLVCNLSSQSVRIMIKIGPEIENPQARNTLHVKS